MSVRYALLDVFTDTAGCGNPLAVILDGDGIGDDMMQTIAADLNLSETVFVCTPGNGVHTAQMRIFTPRREVPFAGHPTVGTAVLLAHDRHPSEGAGGEERDAVVILEEEIGAVRCGVILRNGTGHAVFDAPTLPAPAGDAASDEMLAGALGLLPSEIGFENHRPCVYGAGNIFTFVPVRNLEAIARATVEPALWADALEGRGATGAFLYTRETLAVARQFHARMFAPGAGIAEDPATGSAVAAFAGVVHRFDASPSGNHHLVVEQGFEMGRPSLIALEMDIEAGALTAVRIGGDAVIVERGTLDAAPGRKARLVRAAAD